MKVVAAIGSKRVHLSTEMDALGRSMALCGGLRPHMGYATEAEGNCPKCLALAAGVTNSPVDEVTATSSACKCGCGEQTELSTGYVAGHRPKIGSGISAFSIRMAAHRADSMGILYREIGPYSTGRGHILTKTYDAGKGSTVFIIRYQPQYDRATYAVWAISAQGVVTRVVGEKIMRSYDDLKAAHAAALDYAEYSTLLRQALERMTAEASPARLAEVACAAHYAVAIDEDQRISRSDMPTYKASKAALISAIEAAYPDMDAEAVYERQVDAGDSIADAVYGLRDGARVNAEEAAQAAMEG